MGNDRKMIKEHLLKSFKIAVAALLSIFIAGELGLEYSATAGIITVLSIGRTKRETFRSAANRGMAYICALVLAFVCFKLLGYTLPGFALYLFLFAFFTPYCLINRFSNHDLQENLPDKRTAEPLIAITFTGILSFVYAVFCLIQIVYLFAGLGSLPENYTYASYAREGFFQLVFVCLINLSMILLCKKYFRKSKVLKILLTFVCVCTYIMIASSAYRMILYISAYQLTFLRVFVLWALLVIFLLVSGALVLIYKDDFPLVKFYVVTVTVLYLIFSFAHPDYWIAKYNLNHTFILEYDSAEDSYYYALDKNRDLNYLKRLSLDAAPVIYDKLSEIQIYEEGENWWLDEADWWYKSYSSNLIYESYDYAIGYPLEDYHYPLKMSLRRFNFSRQTAYNAYTAYYDSHPMFAESVNGFLFD